MDLGGKRIILASNSPRRQEIMKGLRIDFTIDTENNFKEYFKEGTPFAEVPVLMSEGKSMGFHRPLEDNEILVTADTMVILDDKILGKPSSREDAAGMLRELSGNIHHVLTAVTIRSNSRMTTFTDTTEVEFNPLSDRDIDYYLDNYAPYDKAGAYGVQEWIGYVGIKRIDGSFYNVVGFPVHRFWEELKAFL